MQARAGTLTNFLAGKIPATWPSARYDNLLIGWAGQTTMNSRTMSVGTAKYSSVATAARANLVTTRSWTITDGGVI